MTGNRAEGQTRRGMGVLGSIFLMVGVLALGISLLSALNTAFDWNLALGTHGTATPLPSDWGAVLGLAAASVLIIALTYFGSTVSNLYASAKGKPLQRLGILAVAGLLLVLAGRGLQVVALTATYGSMLAYYCTDEGSLEDVQAELDDGPTAEELDACLSRTAQWDRADLLEPVIAAGGTFEDASQPDEERRYCVLGSDVSLAYVEKAIELGASPQTCARSATLLTDKVRGTKPGEDEQTAVIVERLLAAGWRADVPGEFSELDAVQEARKRKLTRTLAVLEAG